MSSVKGLTFQNILVVRLGNTCRLSTTERLLQKKLLRHQISSAGFKVLIGNGADFRAIKIALKHGVIAAGHTAHQLTAEMYERADLILVMGPEQIGVVADIHSPARSKATLFARWLSKKTVPDLLNQSSEMSEVTHPQLEEAVRAWARKLDAGA